MNYDISFRYILKLSVAAMSIGEMKNSHSIGRIGLQFVSFSYNTREIETFEEIYIR